MSWKREFPPQDGWVRMDLTLKANTAGLMSNEQIQNLATFGRAQFYEFGRVKQTGRRLVVICRSKAPERRAA